MSAFIQVLLSIITLIVSILLFRKSATTLRPTKMNLISLTFYSLITFSFIGSIFIGLNIDHHYLGHHITNEKTRLIGWGLTQLVMILIPLSIILIEKIFGYKKNEFYIFINRETKTVLSTLDSYMFYIIVGLMTISLISIIYTFYVIGLSNIPILKLIFGASPKELARARMVAGREFKGNQYIRNIFALLLMPLLSYISYAYYKVVKSRKWKSIFIISLISSMAILSYNLEKAPIIRYLLTYIIINIYLGKNVRPRRILQAIFMAGLVIFLQYTVIAGVSSDQIFTLRSGPINRIFLSSSMPLFLHIDIFTYKHKLLEGASFPRVISEVLLGLKHKRSGRVVMELINPVGVAEGIAGVANGLFIAEAYANYGWCGIVFAIIYVGFFIGVVHILFTRAEKTPITVAMYAYLTNMLSSTIHGGFVDFLYNPVLIIIILIYLSILIFSSMLRCIHLRWLER